jgi:hypothetical protein
VLCLQIHWSTLHRHSFRQRHRSHFLLNSHIVSQFCFLTSLQLIILLLSLLIDLQLKSSSSGHLLLFPLELQQSLLVPTVQDVSLPLQLKIDPVVKDSCSCLDVWKVLLCDPRVEVVRLSWRLAIVAVECLVVPLIVWSLWLLHSLLLCLLGLGWFGEVGGLGLPPFFLLANKVSLFDLLLEVVCEVLSFLLLLKLLELKVGCVVG